ncbi:equilibrative nucleotide transporter 3-like [Salvia miltiorrhiza]|uniref:equilibrative nucleotide transporter 3-like n=1 Tax=Salvia miltiorrhiza TaxID=226208 RepID=UPI0025ACFD65|nr:equilibrative nucleotide transporter 3-like [Salvia miltiorrhiza]XP_057796299.1 equilibrative nucleotide transporter 3-like [Salvia miltiorrhiza]
MTNDGDPTDASIPTRIEGRFKAIVICWFLGLGNLVAWNSMLTISDYYYQVFPTYHPSRVLTLVYQPFSFGTMILLAYYEAKINTRMRILFGYTLFSLCTLALLLVDIGTSGKGGIANYIGICVLVGGFGLADAFTQGGIVGDLSFMEPIFLQSFFGGLAASGALTSGLRLVTKWAFDKADDGLRKGVILFLSISTLFEFVCVFLYAYVFGRIPIVKHFRRKAASEGSKTVASDLAAAGIHTSYDDGTVVDRLSNMTLIRQNVDLALDLWLIYALTLSIIPGFLFENTGHHQLGSWYSVVLMAHFNLWDLIGRYVPLGGCLRLESRKGLMMACLSRLLLVPCFYFTARYGEQGWMIVLVSFLGLTNGYLTVCALAVGPKGYKAPEQNALGNLLVVFLIAGIFSGVVLDWLWLINNGSF